MTPQVFQSNKMIFDLKEQHKNKIEELEKIINQLQEEINLIRQFDERLDDL